MFIRLFSDELEAVMMRKRSQSNWNIPVWLVFTSVISHSFSVSNWEDSLSLPEISQHQKQCNQMTTSRCEHSSYFCCAVSICTSFSTTLNTFWTFYMSYSSVWWFESRAGFDESHEINTYHQIQFVQQPTFYEQCCSELPQQGFGFSKSSSEVAKCLHFAF